MYSKPASRKIAAIGSLPQAMAGLPCFTGFSILSILAPPLPPAPGPAVGYGNPMRLHEMPDRKILRRSVLASSALYPGVYAAPHATPRERASECLNDCHVGDAAALAHRLHAVAS